MGMTMRNGYLTCILFLYLFSFPVPIIYNSIYVAFLLSLPLYKERSSSIIIEFVKSKNFILGMSLLFLTFFYYFISTSILEIYDYSLIKIYAGIVIYGAIGVFISSVFCANVKDTPVSKFIFYCLIIQALIIALSFASPVFKSALDIFRTANSVEISDKYYGGGVRGLALSGSQFFGLSVILASMIYLCCVLEYQSKKRTYIYVLLALCSIIFLSVGRTSIFGLVFGLLFLVIKIRNNISLFLKSIVGTIIISIAIIWVLPFIQPSIQEKIDSFIYFAFEAIFNYIQYGEVRTSSTDVLAKMYYPLSLSSLLHGDGQYLNQDGTYYGHTDAGYMRDVLALGIPFTIVLIISFYLIMAPTKRLFDKKNSSSAFFIFAIMLFLLHYKGEVFWTLLSQVSLTFFISTYAHAIKNENTR